MWYGLCVLQIFIAVLSAFYRTAIIRNWDRSYRKARECLAKRRSSPAPVWTGNKLNAVTLRYSGLMRRVVICEDAVMDAVEGDAEFVRLAFAVLYRRVGLLE